MSYCQGCADLKAERDTAEARAMELEKALKIAGLTHRFDVSNFQQQVQRADTAEALLREIASRKPLVPRTGSGPMYLAVPRSTYDALTKYAPKEGAL